MTATYDAGGHRVKTRWRDKSHEMRKPLHRVDKFSSRKNCVRRWKRLGA